MVLKAGTRKYNLHNYVFSVEFAEAVRCNNYELVKRALKGDGKYDMNSADQHGKTLLMHTVQQGRLVSDHDHLTFAQWPHVKHEVFYSN